MGSVDITYVLLGLSVVLNAAQVLFFIYSKKNKKKAQESLELRQFLGDLLSGPAIVAVQRIDPDSILLRSPKQR